MANTTWGEREEGHWAGDYLAPVGPKQESTLLFLVMWAPCGFRASLIFLPSRHKDVPPCAVSGSFPKLITPGGWEAEWPGHAGIEGAFPTGFLICLIRGQ